MEGTKKIGYTFALIGGACWALSGVCGQYLFQYHQITSEWLVPTRLMWAGVLLILLCRLRGLKLTAPWKNKSDIRDMILFAIFGTALCQYSYFSAVAYSDAATATFISYTSPIFIILYTIIGSRKRPTKYELMSVGLVITGVFIIATHGNIHSLHLSGQSLFWGIVSAASFGVYSVQPQRLMKKFDTLLVSGWGMVVGGAILLLLFQPWQLNGVNNIEGYIATAVIILFGTILSYAFYLEGVKRIGATQGSLLSSIEPVVATVLAIVWLNESFEWIDLLGFSIILMTVVALAKEPKEDSPKKPYFQPKPSNKPVQSTERKI